MFYQEDEKNKGLPKNNPNPDAIREYNEKHARITEYVAYGDYYVHPSKAKDWTMYVLRNFDNMEIPVRIIAELGRGKSYDEVAKLLMNDKMTPELSAFTIQTVLQFAKEGPAFIRATVDISDRKLAKQVKKVEKRNHKYNKKHGIVEESTNAF